MIAPARESAGSSPQRRRILVVDDEAPIARALDRILTRAGFGEIVVETDPNRALRSADARDYDAILLDLHMPGVDGFDLMGRFVEQIGEEAYAPIIVITGDRRFNVRERALESGAKDFLQKPFEPAEVVARLRNIIETARMHRRLTSFNELLTQRVDQQTAGLVAAKLEVVERLAKAGEYRDDMTGKHARRVGTLAGLLARDMG
ncbi:MAG: response regulator, partial [Gemmatimonadetes bacterium]|nr:response regulator [Gemmatimonadota bacterium]